MLFDHVKIKLRMDRCKKSIAGILRSLMKPDGIMKGVEDLTWYLS